MVLQAEVVARRAEVVAAQGLARAARSAAVHALPARALEAGLLHIRWGGAVWAGPARARSDLLARRGAVAYQGWWCGTGWARTCTLPFAR